TKRIAIVGAGTAGIVTLKTLLVDIPEDLRRGWEVVVFEQREGVGGIWLPDSEPLPRPPKLPETPLYPKLTTNVAHPTMTVPRFPFPPNTPLYPGHETVLRYHNDIITRFYLTSHVRLSSRIEEARWDGVKWELTIEDRRASSIARPPVFYRAGFDHLVVANGHFHDPYEPRIEGLDAWKARGDKRVMHSIYFRHGEDFAGKNVLIIGGGSSSRDAALQIAPFANSTTVSRKDSVFGDIGIEPEHAGIDYKSRVVSFTPDCVLFADNTTLASVDTVILATGYEHRADFLTRGGSLDVVPAGQQRDGRLSTSLRYVRPLWRHMFALDATLPPTALAFIDLPLFASNGMIASAQALFLGHALADPHILPSRAAMQAELLGYERRLHAEGLDPAYVGHRLIAFPGDVDPDADAAYQDDLVRLLQAAGLAGVGGVPPSGTNFTESWRRYGRAHSRLMRRKWERIEGEGEAVVRKWIGGVRSEEGWARVMQRLVEWVPEAEE
ncbi:hypothetical protein K488DRAFT_38651, partial [Vararia minispora EC-137]